MNDPYKGLGVSPDATDDEIKTAYRGLARKYHPDKYTDSDLAELAAEKMKEINEAYDTVKKMRASGNRSGADSQAGARYDSGYDYTKGIEFSPHACYMARYDSGYDYTKGYTGPQKFGFVRQLINAGRFKEADDILRSMPDSEHTAEWYFLMGCTAAGFRYYVDAQNFFDRACEMDPDNFEYRQIRDKLKRNMDGQAARGGPAPRLGCLDVLCGMMCMDCLCESCFGCGR